MTTFTLPMAGAFLLAGLGLTLCWFLLPLVLAAARDRIAHLVFTLFQTAATPFITPARLVIQAVGAVSDSIAGTVAGLAYRDPDHPLRERSTWEGWLVLGPLVYLALVALLILTELAVGVLRLAPLLGFPVRPRPELDQLSGLAWVATGLVWGAVALDALGWTPFTRPFHVAPARQRRILTGLALLAVLLTCAAGAVLYLVGQITREGGDATALTRVFVATWAVLLISATAVTGWALPTGLAALGVVALLALRIALRGLYAALALVVLTLDALAAVCTAVLDLAVRPPTLLWNWLAESRAGVRLRLHPLAPPAPRTVVGENLAHRLVPAGPAFHRTTSSFDEEFTMSTSCPSRHTALLAIGTASPYLATQLAACAALGTTEDLLAVGLTGVRDGGRRGLHLPAGVADLSVPATQTAALYRTSPSAAAADKLLTGQTLTRVVDMLVRGGVAHPQLIVVVDPADPTAQPTTETVLRELHRLVEGATILVLALTPDTGLLAELRKGGVIDGVIMLDPTGAFARTYGVDTLHQVVATALASLLAAPRQHDLNPTLADLLGALAPDRRLLTVSTGVTELALGERTLLGKLLPVVGGRGRGSLDNVYTQIRQACAEAEAGVPIGTIPVAVVQTVPLRTSDPRWLECVRQSRVELGGRAGLLPVVAAGAGAALDRTSRRSYRTQTTIFAALPVPHRTPQPAPAPNIATTPVTMEVVPAEPARNGAAPQTAGAS